MGLDIARSPPITSRVSAGLPKWSDDWSAGVRKVGVRSRAAVYKSYFFLKDTVLVAARGNVPSALSIGAKMPSSPKTSAA